MMPVSTHFNVKKNVLFMFFTSGALQLGKLGGLPRGHGFGNFMRGRRPHGAGGPEVKL